MMEITKISFNVLIPDLPDQAKKDLAAILLRPKGIPVWWIDKNCYDDEECKKIKKDQDYRAEWYAIKTNHFDSYHRKYLYITNEQYGVQITATNAEINLHFIASVISDILEHYKIPRVINFPASCYHKNDDPLKDLYSGASVVVSSRDYRVIYAEDYGANAAAIRALWSDIPLTSEQKYSLKYRHIIHPEYVTMDFLNNATTSFVDCLKREIQQSKLNEKDIIISAEDVLNISKTISEVMELLSIEHFQMLVHGSDMAKFGETLCHLALRDNKEIPDAIMQKILNEYADFAGIMTLDFQEKGGTTFCKVDWDLSSPMEAEESLSPNN